MATLEEAAETFQQKAKGKEPETPFEKAEREAEEQKKSVDESIEDSKEKPDVDFSDFSSVGTTRDQEQKKSVDKKLRQKIRRDRGTQEEKTNIEKTREAFQRAAEGDKRIRNPFTGELETRTQMKARGMGLSEPETEKQREIIEQLSKVEERQEG